VKVPFQGSRKEKNGLLIIEKPKGNTFKSENRNKEGKKLKMKNKGKWSGWGDHATTRLG